MHQMRETMSIVLIDSHRGGPQGPVLVNPDPSRNAESVTHVTDRGRKRPPPSEELRPLHRKKGAKVTRACDSCKVLKARCSGTLPCDRCSGKGRAANCQYNAEYHRGKLVSPVAAVANGAGPGGGGGGGGGCSNGSHGQEPRPEFGGSSLPPSTTSHSSATATSHEDEFPTEGATSTDGFLVASSHHEATAPSRGSPELGVAEIQGQYYDTTSGLAFLHRAVRRLSQTQKAEEAVANKAATSSSPGPPPPPPGEAEESEESPTLTVGDKPLGNPRQDAVAFPSKERCKKLVHLYFDVCIATYRFLHLQLVESWVDAMSDNDAEGVPLFAGIGRAKAVIVLTVLAIATAHEDKATGRFHEDEVASMSRTDALFSAGHLLLQQETARPTLESAQARIVQVLYLLTSSRMNQAWYVFGTAIQLLSALGLHRKAENRQQRRRPQSAAADDQYIQRQCGIKTFWTAYILDKYLGVMFGRPRHYHDEDIDQEMPQSINDEDMTPTGPRSSRHSYYYSYRRDSYIDALIRHVQIARLISESAQTVYSIRRVPERERIAAANRLNRELARWRDALPPYLGGGGGGGGTAIRPSSLVISFRRQAIVLKIAYCHAVMHVNRLFLLRRRHHHHHHHQPRGGGDNYETSSSFLDHAVDDAEEDGDDGGGGEVQIRQALAAAYEVLETVDEMVRDGGTIFHAFWWTHYVAFCALAIIYAWELQRRRRRRSNNSTSGSDNNPNTIIGEKEDFFGSGGEEEEEEEPPFLELAERCQGHLAQATLSNSPSRRYAQILERLRMEVVHGGGGSEQQKQQHVIQQDDDDDDDDDVGSVAVAAAGRATTLNLADDNNTRAAANEEEREQTRSDVGSSGTRPVLPPQQERELGLSQAAQLSLEVGHGNISDHGTGQTPRQPFEFPAPLEGMDWALEEWQSADWLNLDYMSFGPLADVQTQPIVGMGYDWMQMVDDDNT